MVKHSPKTLAYEEKATTVYMCVPVSVYQRERESVCVCMYGGRDADACVLFMVYI